MLKSVIILCLGEEHSHSDVCPCGFHTLLECVRCSARCADVVNEQNALALEEILVYPHVVLGCMFSANVDFLTLSDNLYMVEPVYCTT